MQAEEQANTALHSLMELQLILATMAQRVRLDVVPGHPIVLEPGVTLRPKHGMLMTAHQR